MKFLFVLYIVQSKLIIIYICNLNIELFKFNV